MQPVVFEKCEFENPESLQLGTFLTVFGLSALSKKWRDGFSFEYSPTKKLSIEIFLEKIEPVFKEKEEIEQHGTTYFQLSALFSDYRETKTGNKRGKFLYK